MQKLFGIELDSLALYLAGTFAVLVGILLFQAFRNPILVKLGVRNIPKRPGQSLLIVIGLMLSTVIIGASLGIGDTVYKSIRIVAVEGAGQIDEEISSPLRRFDSSRYFSEDKLVQFSKLLDGDSRVDGLGAGISTNLPVMNPETNRSESRTAVRGYRSIAINGTMGIDTKVTSIEGIIFDLNDLKNSEVVLNRNASETLEAYSGSIINIYTSSGVKSYSVRLVAEHGGIASGGDTKLVLMSLKQIQNLTQKDGLIDEIYVSNMGGIEEGLKYSSEVAKLLRLSLVDKIVAEEIGELIKSEEVFQLIDTKLNDVEFTNNNPFGDEVVEDLQVILGEIRDNNFSSDKYLSLIADENNLGAILWILSRNQEFEDQAGDLGLLSPTLNQLRVQESKADALRLAETVGASVTYLFSIFGSFSIIVGLLLIFLVMVLLASSRSTEMGMARAIGLKRRHLVQMFTFEGSMYALAAAVIGTALGAFVSIVLVGLLQQVVGSDDFKIRTSFTIRSIWITFSTGFLLTLITIGISSFRVSKLNIVVAIRGLSEQFTPKSKIPLGENIRVVVIGFLGPIYLIPLLRKGITISRIIAVFKSLILWPISITRQIFRITGLILAQGWVLILLGIAIHRLGINLENASLFSIGVSISIIGLGLLLRKILVRVNLSRVTVNRIAATLEGGLLVTFWGLPFDFFEFYHGKLDSGPEIFVLGGVAQIGSAVWLIMNNSEILLAFSNKTLGRLSGLQATFKTAIAYPVAAPFRTGLTVSMFGLIIFTLMIFAVLNNLNNVAREQPNRVTGGYDIEASVRPEFAMDIQEFENIVNKSSNLNLEQFEVVAQSVRIPAIGREIGSSKQYFTNLSVRSVDDIYMRTTLLEFVRVHPDYRGDPSKVWNALNSNPNLAVASNSALPTDDPFAPTIRRNLELDSIAPESEKDYWPEDGIRLEILSRQGTGEPVEVEIIGIIDSLADQQDFSRSVYIVASESIGNSIIPDLQGYDTYSIRLSSGVLASDLIPYLETEFLERGMSAVSTIEQIERSLETGDAFNKLFQGFMSLGLVVGVIAIGVLSIRAVVERRQAIGTMRAIGYRARMIWLSFLLEALYITFLGIAVGLALGALTSWNIFNEIAKEVDGITYKIPWLNVLVIVAITTFFALLSSFLPSKQASKIYPAEALRYE